MYIYICEKQNKKKSLIISIYLLTPANQTKVSEIINNKEFLQYVEACMVTVNTAAISNAAAVKKWAFCPVDFSIPGNELGPTLKLKRRVIHNKYAALIDSLYD